MMYKKKCTKNNKCMHTMWISRKKIVQNQEQRTRHLNSQHEVHLCLYTLCGLLHSACEWCIESTGMKRKKHAHSHEHVDINSWILELRVQCGRNYSVWYFDGELMILVCIFCYDSAHSRARTNWVARSKANQTKYKNKSKSNQIHIYTFCFFFGDVHLFLSLRRRKFM